MASVGLRSPSGYAPGGRGPVGSQEAELPEAESFVAFEAPAEEPNLTLVVDSFLPRNSLLCICAKHSLAIACRLSVRPSVRL